MDQFTDIDRLIGREWQTCEVITGHQGEVNDIAIDVLDDRTTLVASCGRDRTVQVYSKENSVLSLLQTINHHGSSVNSLCFLDQGKLLLSSSSDRTIMVNALAESEGSKAFIPFKIITLKQSPISMSSSLDEPGVLLVTTMDKQLHRFLLPSGQLVNSVRLMDESTSVLLSSITSKMLHCGGICFQLLVGFSATDKSVRIHDTETGLTILKDYGHSENVSDMIIFNCETSNGKTKYTIVSTSFEGTVMLWELVYSRHPYEDQSAMVPSSSESPTPSQPLRKVISRSALANFPRSLDIHSLPWLPTTPTTPTRKQSPTRLNSNTSRHVLSRPTSKEATPVSRTLNQSASLHSHAVPLIERRRLHVKDRSPTYSTSDLKDTSYSIDRLLSSLRAYRKHLSSSADMLDPDITRELEMELALTMKIIKDRS